MELATQHSNFTPINIIRNRNAPTCWYQAYLCCHMAMLPLTFLMVSFSLTLQSNTKKASEPYVIPVTTWVAWRSFSTSGYWILPSCSIVSCSKRVVQLYLLESYSGLAFRGRLIIHNIIYLAAPPTSKIQIPLKMLSFRSVCQTVHMHTHRRSKDCGITHTSIHVMPGDGVGKLLAGEFERNEQEAELKQTISWAGLRPAPGVNWGYGVIA